MFWACQILSRKTLNTKGTKYTKEKENKFKKQIAERMKDNPEIAASYGEENEFNRENAIDVINKYNAWKAGQ